MSGIVQHTARISGGVHAHDTLRGGLNKFASAVVRLGSVDPVTTEIVRLRCASHHQCGT
jgi:hypothetical protein